MLVIVLLGLFLAQGPARTAALPDLPRLEFDNYLPATRDQVQQVYATARANPNNAEATGRLGMVLDAYEQYDAALICYRRAHALDPGSFRWLYYLGWVQAAQGQHQNAMVLLRDTLQLRPDYLPAQLRLAETLLALGKLEESRYFYQAIGHMEPGSAEAFYGLGRVELARGDLASAVSAFTRSCELFPQYGAAHYALAMAYRKLGRDDESRKQFVLYEQNKTAVPPLDDPLRREVTALNQGSVAHIRRGAELERAGRIEEAIAEQLEALRADPRAVQAQINLVSLYGRVGRFDEATAHYQAALALDRNQADLHYNYGVLALKQGRIADARAAFEEAVRINPSYAEARNNLGMVYEQGGRLDEALRQFEAAVENRPGDRVAHFHIGRILANQQKYDGAIQHFQKTLTPEDENTPRYLYALGATYARAGDYPSAIKYLREARTQAISRGQDQLVGSIDRDLKPLEAVDVAKP